MINTAFSLRFNIFDTINKPDMLWQYVFFCLEVQFLYEETYVFENERILFIYFFCTKY
jgi:hypothetical protein